jgi:hypothetical protein
VIYPGSTPVGNATLVVANVLTCNKHSQYCGSCTIVIVPSNMVLHRHCFLCASYGIGDHNPGPIPAPNAPPSFAGSH